MYRTVLLYLRTLDESVALWMGFLNRFSLDRMAVRALSCGIFEYDTITFTTCALPHSRSKEHCYSLSRLRSNPLCYAVDAWVRFVVITVQYSTVKARWKTQRSVRRVNKS